MPEYLCEELIDEILERLPPKSLLRFRSISKSWYCRISSPNFIRKHTIRSVTTRTHKKIPIRVITCFNKDLAYIDWSIFTDEYTRREFNYIERNYRITGLCFGIICMDTRTYYNPSVILWNPSVRRKFTVPDYPRRQVHVSYGFGFDPINDDYKIVGLCVHASFVYSIKTNSWCEIQVPTTCRFSQVRSYGYFVDGALHWVVQYETNSITHNYILIFNLSTHVFGLISLPKPNWWNNQLTIIQDPLALISTYFHEQWAWIRREKKDDITAYWSEQYYSTAGLDYSLELDSDYRYTINMDICGETLELLDKDTC